MKTTLDITGMHCNACVQRLTRAFQAVPDVTTVTVTLSPPQAVIDSDHPIPLEALSQAAISAGAYAVKSTGSSKEPAPLSALPATSAEPRPSIYPLLLIVSYIAGTTALTTMFRTAWSWHTFMNDFMAGFFLVFSFFKFLDLRGFADTYQTYDIVARFSRPWAFAYPFMELALGVAYLTRFQPVLTNWVTLVLMLVGSIGVLRALLRKDAIRCACLGTALNLPMTTVTLTEDLAMAGMAASMLVLPAP